MNDLSGSSGRYYAMPWWRTDALKQINQIAQEVFENDWDLQRCLSGDSGPADTTTVREANHVAGSRYQPPFQDQSQGYNARIDPDGTHNRVCMWRFSELPERPGMRELAAQVRDMFPMTHHNIDLDEAYHNCFLWDIEGLLYPHTDITLPAIKLIVPLDLNIAPLEFYTEEQELIGTYEYQGPTLVKVDEFHGVMSSKARRQHFQYMGFNEDFETIVSQLEAIHEN